MLECGEVATPFEHESYGDNLQKCQRYFYKYISNDDYGPLGANGMQINTNATAGIMFLNTRSAVLQTISSFNYINWTDNNPCPYGINWTSSMEVSIRVVNLILALWIVADKDNNINSIPSAVFNNILEHGKYIIRNLEITYFAPSFFAYLKSNIKLF